MNTNILCIDIGGSSLKCAVCGHDGTIKHKKSSPMASSLDALCNMMKEYKLEMEQMFCLEGVAISSCGAVQCNTGIIKGTSAVPYIHGPSWIKLIQQYLSLPCEIENDANCAALSELYYGEAKDIQDMCFLVIGTGVGGAIVKSRKIHHGAHVYGGEFGMMLVKDMQGDIVNTSLVASTSSMVRKIEKRLGGEWNGELVFEKAQKGQKDCLEVIETFYEEVAFCVFNIQHMYDPEMILFGGAISARNDFCTRVMRAYETLCEQLDFETLIPVLKSCTYLQDANIIGALAHYKQRQTT